MADSTVKFANIDEDYPVAGQDNDSQGFRDNFTEIKQALQNTNLELTDLLSNSARLDGLNDFNGQIIQNAVQLAVSQKSYNTPTLEQDTTIEWSDGAYQNIIMGGDHTLILGGWPADAQYAKMRLALRTNNANSRVVTWEPANAGQLRVSANWPQGDFRVTSQTTPIIVDVWTTNAGATVFMEYIGEFAILS